MSEEILNQEPMVDEEELHESQVEETPVSEDDMTIEEGAKKAKEEEYEEEVQTEQAPQIQIPKTKAGTIQAAVEMLKKARKEDAQKLFAKMIKVDEAEEDKSVKDAENATKPKQAKAPTTSGAGDKHTEAFC